MLDFNLIWGDGTTSPFSEKGISFRIFNSPRGSCFGRFPLHLAAHSFINIYIPTLTRLFCDLLNQFFTFWRRQF